MFFAPAVSYGLYLTAVLLVTLQLGEQSGEPFKGLYFTQQVLITSVSSCGRDWSMDH